MHSNSITRGLFIRNSAHGNNRLTLIDTPGTESKIEAAKHAILLKESFTFQPINAIFVMVPYFCRSDFMLDTLEDTIMPIYNTDECKKRIVIVVSKFD